MKDSKFLKILLEKKKKRKNYRVINLILIKIINIILTLIVIIKCLFIKYSIEF
jgi:hypothetical protein